MWIWTPTAHKQDGQVFEGAANYTMFGEVTTGVYLILVNVIILTLCIVAITASKGRQV